MYNNDLYRHFDARLISFAGISEKRWGENSERRCYNKNYWVLDYLAEGEGLFKTSAPGRSWRIRKEKEAHLYPPGTIYWEQAGKCDNFKSSFIIFQCSESAGIKDLIPSPDHYGLFYDDSSILLKLFRKFDTVMFLSEAQQFLMAQSIFWETMLYLTSCQPSSSGDYHITSDNMLKHKSPLIQNILSWINKNYAGKITMLDLSRKFALSRTALYQRFFDETGETPFLHINRLRLKHADDLILQGYKLKEIAAQTGFSSEYHLSRAYKKQYGIPPGKTRGFRK